MPVDLRSAIPKHQQAAEFIRRLITREGLKPGDRLPSEKAIAEQLDISLMTANKALVSLAREGLVVRYRGRGTFVADPNHRPGRTATLWALLAREKPDAELTHSELSFGAIYRALHSEIRDLNGAILPLDDHATDYLSLATRSDIAGLILIAPDTPRKLDLLTLTRNNTPFVVISASWPGLSLPCVDGDNVGGARDAVRYLAELGHRRLAMVISRMQETNSRDRRVGFEYEASEQGLPPAPVLEIEESEPQDWNEVRALLSGPDRPSAIFAGGYELALQTLEVARELRLEVPQDPSLVGFDDVPSAARLTPPLTTVRQPWGQIARRAVEKLARMRSLGEMDYTTEILPMELVIRGSCCPP